MRKYIDLSQSIIHDMPIHPYDDKVILYQDKYLDKDKYVNHRLELACIQALILTRRCI